MAYVEIRDDTIWANHIEGGKILKDRIISLAPGEVIDSKSTALSAPGRRPVSAKTAGRNNPSSRSAT